MYDAFLEAFRTHPKNQSQQRGMNKHHRGSINGSQYDAQSRATPTMWRASTTSKMARMS